MRRYRRLGMMVGYEDASGGYVCAACWQDETRTERRANAVLSDAPDEHDDDFWLCDYCERCGKTIMYRSQRLLD